MKGWNYYEMNQAVLYVLCCWLSGSSMSAEKESGEKAERHVLNSYVDPRKHQFEMNENNLYYSYVGLGIDSEF
jgi:hypothetical protein